MERPYKKASSARDSKESLQFITYGTRRIIKHLVTKKLCLKLLRTAGFMVFFGADEC